jgi:succinate dehydrogenase / fumarate reductase, cytochrome b subunit
MRGTRPGVQRGRKPGLYEAATSPVGRKILTGITGIALVLFVLMHMIGNLTYFAADSAAYNMYADFLVSTGPLLYFIEGVLVIAFSVHIVIGIAIYVRKWQARKTGYARYSTAGDPSRMTYSSRTMIVTGIVLLVFLVIHLKTFKYGPGIGAGYVAEAGGESIRDIKRLVTETFQSPLYTFGYVAVMTLLGLHLRHGVWSAFQSIGAMSPRLTPLVYTIGTILAILIAVGFFILPLYIYLFV